MQSKYDIRRTVLHFKLNSFCRRNVNREQKWQLSSSVAQSSKTNRPKTLASSRERTDNTQLPVSQNPLGSRPVHCSQTQFPREQQNVFWKNNSGPRSSQLIMQ